MAGENGWAAGAGAEFWYGREEDMAIADYTDQ
jgi:hypothetical protein